MATTTLPKPKSPRRGGRYSSVKNQPRQDLPGLRPRSSWDANLLRMMRWLGDGNRPHDPYFAKLLGPKAQIFRVEYEMEQGSAATFFFPGSKATGNARYTPDIPFQVMVIDQNHNTGHLLAACGQFYLEGKGSLKEGGWLLDIDLDQLKGVDDDSRVKLERFKRYYPGRARDTFVVGQREYKALTQAYKDVVPHWE